MPTFCKDIMSALNKAGFDDQLRAALTQEENADVLRSALLDLLSKGTSTYDFQRHLNEDMFTVPFSPLRISVTEWRKLIQRKTDRATEPKDTCRINPHDMEAFFGGEYFSDTITAKDPSILLVNSKIGNDSIDAVVESAETYMKGCYASTKPRLIFELLNTFWSKLSSISASFIIVPTPMAHIGGKFPILINSVNGNVLSFAKSPPPKLSKFSGYIAFCGTTSKKST